MTFELKGWHVLSMMLAFFGLIVAVNVTFTIYALDTFAGEDVPLAYMKGLAYNQTLDARAAQAKLNWKAEIDAGRTPSGAAVVDARLVDVGGRALSGLAVTATLRRPTNSALDRNLSLVEIGAGKYAAQAENLHAGQWDIIIRTTAGDGTPFEAVRRVQLP